MIGRLTGILVEKNSSGSILLDVNGVAYEIETPLSTFAILPAINEKFSLLIQQIIREDVHLLFGFASADEKSLFKLLIKVSGIGPKTALIILSGINVQEFFEIIQNEDVVRLSKIPSIGKKTAERLILELKDKVKNLVPHNISNTLPISPLGQNDAISALISLGYKPADAEKMIKKIYSAELSVDTLIRLALQQAMK